MNNKYSNSTWHYQYIKHLGYVCIRCCALGVGSPGQNLGGRLRFSSIFIKKEGSPHKTNTKESDGLAWMKGRGGLD